MKRILLLILAATFVCFCGNSKKSTEEQLTESQTPAEAIAAMQVTGEPHYLTDCKLTSGDAVLALTGDQPVEITYITTPVEKVLFIPEQGIVRDELVEKIRCSFNFSVMTNQFEQSDKIFNRLIMDIAIEREEYAEPTANDYINCWRKCRPRISSTTIDKAFDKESQRNVVKKVAERFKYLKGDIEGDSLMMAALEDYKQVAETATLIVSQDTLDLFEKTFWEWYDKSKCAPEVNVIVKQHLQDAKYENVPDSIGLHFYNVIMSENDIDRRTALALEYAKFDIYEGPFILGDIIESGIYTKYLLEAFVSWRANLQLCMFGGSSCSLIPNNYYDTMRAKCINTILRHYQSTGDYHDLCLIQNLLGIEGLKRFGWLMGNESGVIGMHLDYEWFIR